MFRHVDGGVLGREERELMKAMLARRRRRPQPEVDRKIVTAWNALTGTALVIAGRYLDRPQWIRRAIQLRNALFRTNGVLAETDSPEPGISFVRSSLDGQKSSGEFLEDYAAVLLLETHLLELDDVDQSETDNPPAPSPAPSTVPSPAPSTVPSTTTLAALEQKVLRFYRSGDEPGWDLSIVEDFPAVPADEFDAPTPSAISLAEYALLRSVQIRDVPLTTIPGAPAIEGGSLPVGAEQVRDFHNIAALFSAGEIPVLHRPEPLGWRSLPPGTMQIPSERTDWCYRGACRPGDPPFLK